MSYETLRNTFAAQLLSCFNTDVTNQVLSNLDVIASDYNIERKSHDLIVPVGIPEIVKIYIAAKAIENCSKPTLYSYKLTLTAFFSAIGKPFDKITANDIRAYLYNYKKTHQIADSSLDQIRSIVCSFFEWLANEEYLPRNPAAKIGKINFQYKERSAMSPLELEIIRSACHTIREKALVDLLYSTGCRVSEVAGLLISDVDLDNATVTIRHGKGNKSRISYLNAESIISLRAYLASRKDSCESLFVSERKPCHPITSRAIEVIINDIRKRTNVKTHVTPHVFRHTTATVAIRSGMPVEQVQRLLGHSNINTTMIYVDRDDTAIKANHQRYVS